MTRTFDGQANGRTGWRARVFVLGPLAIAALCTAASLGLSAGTEHLGPLWVAAIAWTVAASLAGALWQGFRHRDWSAFGRYRLPDGRDDLMEWSSKTGAYSHMRDWEDRHRHDDDHLR